MLASGNGVRMVYDGDGSDIVDGGASEGSAAIEQIFLDYFASQSLPTTAEGMFIPSDSYWTVLYGVPTGGLFSGAFRVKEESDIPDYGGIANQMLDPCYHLGCDRVENTNVTLYTELSKRDRESYTGQTPLRRIFDPAHSALEA